MALVEQGERIEADRAQWLGSPALALSTRPIIPCAGGSLQATQFLLGGLIAEQTKSSAFTIRIRSVVESFVMGCDFETRG